MVMLVLDDNLVRLSKLDRSVLWWGRRNISRIAVRSSVGVLVHWRIVGRGWWWRGWGRVMVHWSVVAVVVDGWWGSIGRSGVVVLLWRKEVLDFFSLLGQKAGLSGRVVSGIRRWWVLVVLESLLLAAEDAAAVGRHVEVDQRLLDELTLFVG